MKYITTLIVMVLFAIACSQNEASSKSTTTETQTPMHASETSSYTTDMVVNTKDYACGMPTSAGISDTCHYEGKAYGFCSSECKAEFQKDPSKFLASNQ